MTAKKITVIPTKENNYGYVFGETHVKLTNDNKKMGEGVFSVSVSPYKSCRRCGCMEKKPSGKTFECYALNMYHKAILTMPGHEISCVGESWERNSAILENEPERFWREVESGVMMARYFRFHVGGDFVNDDYFRHVVEIAKRQPHCQILAFTKKFSIVNDYVKENGMIPDNLHILFSGWKGLKMDNPYNFSECHVIEKDGSTTAHEGKSFLCTGSCEACIKAGCGCWAVEKGTQILIKKH